MVKTNSESITIVYATNDDYAAYMGVSIFSLIKHASLGNQYDIFVLEEKLSLSQKTKIKSLETDNVKIEFVNVQNLMQNFSFLNDVYLKCGYVKKESAFRLLIGDVFSNKNKVLYIDCDTIINKDIAILYNENIEDYVLGVCFDHYCGLEKDLKYLSDNVDIAVNKYFNTGIVLINIQMYNKCRIGINSLEFLAKKHYRFSDQDVLNITCNNKVKYLDSRWNAQWASVVIDGFIHVEDENKKIKELSIEDPYIIHYTTSIKPWKHPQYRLADLFWKYARMTSFYEEIIFINMKEDKEKIIDNTFDRFVFPWELINHNESIIIYGAGIVGRTFVNQIMKTQYANIVAICDKNHANISDLQFPVISKERICEYNYDKILIAIEKSDIANVIIKDLVNIGLEKERIFWSDYKRK